jgi:hypothetical protein
VRTFLAEEHLPVGAEQGACTFLFTNTKKSIEESGKNSRKIYFLLIKEDPVECFS